MQKQKQSRNKAKVSLFITIFVLIAFSLVFTLLYSSVVKNTVFQKSQEDMRISVRQANAILDGMITAEMERLKMIAVFCSSAENVQYVSWGELVYQEGKPNRTGILDLKGRLYSGTNQYENAMEKEVLQTVWDGESLVSGVMEGRDGKKIIACVYPIYHFGRVVGAAYSEYHISDLWNCINASHLKNGGNLYIIEDSGQLIVWDENVEQEGNFFERFSNVEMMDDVLFQDVYRSIRNGGEGFLGYEGDSGMVFIQYQKAAVHNWCILSMVEENHYNQQLKDIEYQSYIILVINLIIYTSLLISSLLLIRCYQQETREAKKDVLTGVCNRELARSMMTPHLNLIGRKRVHACIYMDVDFFKKINDTYGHKEGDSALKKVANILQESVRKGDIVARFGGDEFCVWLRGIHNEEKIVEIVDYIFYRVRKETNFTISMGIAIYPVHGTHYDELLKRADEALYTAKRAGRNRYYICRGKTEEKSEE